MFIFIIGGYFVLYGQFFNLDILDPEDYLP
jgi:hypothetical protein